MSALRNLKFPYAKFLRVILLAVVIIGMVLLRKYLGLEEVLSVAAIHDWFEMNALLGSLVFILLFTVGNFMQIPGFIFLAAAIAILGKFYGGLLILVSALISSALIFIAIDWLGHNILGEIKYAWVKRLLLKLHQRPIAIVLCLRVIFQTAPALNYTLALSGIKFRDYMVGTLLGLPLPIFIYVLFFERVLAIFAPTT